MKAIIFDQPGDESVLRYGEAPDPILGPEDIRIRVVSTAVNRADIMQRRGLYPPPAGASPILGLECAGTVMEIGKKVPRGFQTGDPVMALLAGGGYAEQVVVHHGSVLRVPPSLPLEHAGGLPEVFLTVHLNVFMLGRLAKGGSMLVHGGGSGVGTAAIQMVREAGARSYVTAGSEEKCRRCVELGASAAINYKTEDFAARIKELTDGRGVDVVLDSIGGSYLESNLASLAAGGRLVVIGLTGGAKAPINLALLLLLRLEVIGSTLRVRPVGEKAEIVRSFEERFGEAVAAGRLRPIVDRILPLAEAAEAHRVVGANEHFGKVILRVS